MTYAELSRFGVSRAMLWRHSYNCANDPSQTLRKQHKLGPYGMFLRLLNEWGGAGKLSPREIADKVKRFHHYHFVRIWCDYS